MTNWNRCLVLGRSSNISNNVPICTFSPTISAEGRVTWEDGRSYRLSVLKDGVEVFSTPSAVISPYFLPTLQVNVNYTITIIPQLECEFTPFQLTYPCPESPINIILHRPLLSPLSAVHDKPYRYEIYEVSGFLPNVFVTSGVLPDSGDTPFFAPEDSKSYEFRLVGCEPRLVIPFTGFCLAQNTVSLETESEILKVKVTTTSNEQVKIVAVDSNNDVVDIAIFDNTDPYELTVESSSYLFYINNGSCPDLAIQIPPVVP